MSDDLCEIISECEFTVERQTNLGTYDSQGFAKKPKIKSFKIRGSIQPISGIELLQVDENDRKRGVFDLFTLDEITTDDVIVDRGVRYEVQVVNDWRNQCLPHIAARIVRIDVAKG